MWREVEEVGVIEAEEERSTLVVPLMYSSTKSRGEGTDTLRLTQTSGTSPYQSLGIVASRQVQRTGATAGSNGQPQRTPELSVWEITFRLCLPEIGIAHSCSLSVRQPPSVLF